MDRTWTVIKFLEDNTVQAVPTTWIILTNNECYWPPYTNDKIAASIRKCEPPSQTWPKHSIRVLRNSTYGDYQTARSKEKKAESVSDLNSDTEEERRKRKIKRFSLSSSEDEETEDQSLLQIASLPRPPKLTSKILQSVQNQETTDDHEISNKDKSHLLTTNCEKADLTGFMKQIIRKQSMIQSTQFQILQELSEIKNSINNPNVIDNIDFDSSIFTFFDFPLNTEEELRKFEEFLIKKENYEKTTKEFFYVGGANSYDAIKRILSKVISDELASTYSYYGAKKKNAFNNLLLSRAVIQASMKILKEVTIKNLEDAIKNWLRRAKERAESKFKKDKNQSTRNLNLSAIP